MTNLRDLNRAVQNATFPSPGFASAVRGWIAAATERMEGKGGKCRMCDSPVDLFNEHARFNHDTETWSYTCEPAPPSEMPEAVRLAVEALISSAQRDEEDGEPIRADILKSRAGNLTHWWRSQPAPAKVDTFAEDRRIGAQVTDADIEPAPSSKMPEAVRKFPVAPHDCGEQ